MTSELTTAKTGAEDMHNEYKHQRAHLESSVDKLNDKLKKVVACALEISGCVLTCDGCL